MCVCACVHVYIHMYIYIYIYAFHGILPVESMQEHAAVTFRNLSLNDDMCVCMYVCMYMHFMAFPS